jgi:hypothetical protein
MSQETRIKNHRRRSGSKLFMTQEAIQMQIDNI